MEIEGHPLAEEVVRLLATAANAARLYPPSSPLPVEALQRFIARSNEVTNSIGPLRYILDPHGFRVGDQEIVAGQSQVVAFAEALHAMQVGQLVIAPDLTETDAHAFIGVANTDPTQVRQQGVREALAQAGVSRIAVIEVTLRASSEEGILGLDLTAAPLDELGREVLAATEKWSQTAQAGQGVDDVRAAIDRLEDATRDIATERIAEALLHLDEESRMRLLAYGLRSDTTGSRMTGGLDVLTHMNPASLARLLRIVAQQAGADENRLAGALELPPELAREVAMLLAPSPRSEADCGVPAEPDVERIVDDVFEDADGAELDRQIALSSPSLASGRALTTTVAVSRSKADVEAVRAIGQALPIAARDGAFSAVRGALRRLDEMGADASLALEIEQARNSLQDPEILADVCRAPLTDADAAIAGEILSAAGTSGAEALLDYYIHANEAGRSLLRPVLRGFGEPLLAVSSRRLRSGDTAAAVAVVRVLPLLGDRRVVPVLQQALEHLDVQVRREAVTALAETPGPDSRAALTKALGHWDPETKRHVIAEIGRAGATEAIPPLTRILGDINVFERNHELKKEVIKSLESLGSPDALPVLRRVANRRFVFGRKNKELRFLAQRAADQLSRTVAETPQGVDAQ
ncbi:MAG: HEAT repeat domain-containing protein [Coriobacteriia bacterium]|nr:HEAT repeat domain-containing protein [Coriobacteriia bacterium]